MSNNIDAQAIHDYLRPVIASLSPQNRKKMATKIAKTIQHRNSKRIKENTDPDGTAYAARKDQGRRTKTGAMMPKLFRLKHLKRKVDANGLVIGFYGRAKHAADVHHFGLKDKVSPNHEAEYTARPLLGLNDEDKDYALNIVLAELQGNGS